MTLWSAIFTDGVIGDPRSVDLLEVHRNFPGGQSAGAEGEHDLIKPVPVQGSFDLDRANFDQHGPRSCAVMHVGCDRRLPVVVPDVLGQLRLEDGSEDVLC